MAKQSFLSSSIRSIMMAGFGTALLAGAPAYAQDQSEDDQQNAEEKEVTEKIQVTGSRIRTDGLDSPTPIEIISADIAQDEGLNTLGELLRTSTVAAGSDQLISAYSVGYVTNGGSGAESISMRGLGANRTLVLLNGRRAGPAGTRGQVSAFDMNALPISVIERVEILKDGASSLYGSDAVAGVINIITKRGEGGEVNVSGSKPFESGGETVRINATYGEATDRGSWRLVADHNVNTGMKRNDRDYFQCQESLYFDAGTGERADLIDPRTGEYYCAGTTYGMFGYEFLGRFASGRPALAGAGRIQYDYDGFGFPDLSSENPFVDSNPDGWYWAGYDNLTGFTTESNALIDGGSNPHFQNATIVPRSTTSSLYLQGDYDLTDSTSFYGELLHSRRVTKSNGVRQFWTRDISALDPTVGGGQIPIEWAPGFSGDGWIMPVHLTNHSGGKTTVDYTRAVIGLEGSIGFWNWDMSYQRSHNGGKYDDKVILTDSYTMALETLLGVPCDGRTTEISGRSCVEYDWFDPQNLAGNQSEAARGFLFGRDIGNTTYKQDTFDAYITGDLLDLPAGPVGTALGVYWQKDEINDTPGDVTLNNNSWGRTAAGITAGKAITRAYYAEFQIPVLRDLPLVESLDLTASGRWTHVNVYGSDTTYKLSANWEVGAGVRVRASRGTSFRAPALYELYLENQTGFRGQTDDPCLDWGESTNPLVRANCAAAGIPEDYDTAIRGSYTSITGGGAGQLNAETSVSEGVGIVYTSPEGRFAASADFYDVIIRDQIANVSGAAVLSQCYTSEDFANEPFCDQITRGDIGSGDYGLVEVRGGYLNTAQQVVRGVDFVFTYQDSFDFGDVRVKWDHTNQIERSFQQFSGDEPFQYIGLVGNPKHIGSIRTTFSRDDWNYNWTVTYSEKTEDYTGYFDGENTSTYRGEDITFIAELPSLFYHSLSASTTFDDNIDVTFGISNLFDKQPPAVSSGVGYGLIGNVPLFASQIDYLGRRAFFNVSYRF
ncbi:TonB-dependent receptor domain-containing protein [Pseudidiomarina salilacus]|uniref:TonB-dependent receptor domain-containing protein n=1 Tax=Pseudidiomarina salilacus TaxID=3384452 RepID=UPI0039854F8C